MALKTKKFISPGQRIIASAVLVSLSFVLKQLYGYVPVTVAVMGLSTFVAGIPIFLKAVSALRYKIVGIDALVTIAVIGALFIGEYWEAAAVTFLFIFGGYLEARTIEKTRSSIKSLLDLAPLMARVRRGGVDVEVSPEEVVKGDLVVIKPGEKIAVDGTVVEGSGYVNQASITGESVPVFRGVAGATDVVDAGDGDDANSSVFSGTIIESGYLIVRADRVGEDTTFARILRMVEDAQDKKAKTQKFLEKFSRWYTPGIIALTFIVFLITRDVSLSLTLLVISCPGALVISAPVSIVAGIGNGAKHGVLVKGGDIMEKLGTVKAIAFDKTGTLTKGKNSVTKIRVMGDGDSGGLSEREVLRLAAIGESYSEHPLARAILRKAEEDLGGVSEKPENTEIIPGQGLTFYIEEKKYLLGNRKLFESNGVDASHVEAYVRSEEDLGQTVVLIGDSEKVLGVISIADTLRPEAKKLVKDLKKLGLKHVVMLTGDNERAARVISAELGLDEFYAELLPEDKVRVLGELQNKYGRVAMVGDGVNDAPALASADLGIAIGGEGTDVAMETADVVLLSAEVQKLSFAMGLSRATVHNMKQNIVFALVVAAVLLTGVLVKTVNLSFGMLVHEVSVLLVIINAVRLLGYKDKRVKKKNS